MSEVPPRTHARSKAGIFNTSQVLRIVQGVSVHGKSPVGERNSTTVPARYGGGLVFDAHRLLYHSTLDLRVIKKKQRSYRKWRRDPSGVKEARSTIWLQKPF